MSRWTLALFLLTQRKLLVWLPNHVETAPFSACLPLGYLTSFLSSYVFCVRVTKPGLTLLETYIPTWTCRRNRWWHLWPWVTEWDLAWLKCINVHNEKRISGRRKKSENAVSMIQTLGECNPAVLDVMSSMWAWIVVCMLMLPSQAWQRLTDLQQHGLRIRVNREKRREQISQRVLGRCVVMF